MSTEEDRLREVVKGMQAAHNRELTRLGERLTEANGRANAEYLRAQVAEGSMQKYLDQISPPAPDTPFEEARDAFLRAYNEFVGRWPTNASACPSCGWIEGHDPGCGDTGRPRIPVLVGDPPIDLAGQDGPARPLPGKEEPRKGEPAGEGSTLQDEVVSLRKRVKEQARQLTNQQAVLHKKNLALDAMHYVWCDGGCEGGTHRFDEGKITEELIAVAERNTKRLRSWFVNNRRRKDARQPAVTEEPPLPVNLLVPRPTDVIGSLRSGPFLLILHGPEGSKLLPVDHSLLSTALLAFTDNGQK